MEKQLHVVILPWSAFGHLMPLFQLSIALAEYAVQVSFISTPTNIRRLPKPPSHLSPLLNFVEFALPVLDNYELLPEGAEATVDIPSDKVQYLKIAFDLLQHPLKQFVADQSPDWIISDVLSYWAGIIALEYEIPLMLFSVFSASAVSFLWHPDSLVGDGQKIMRPSAESLTSVPEWVDFSSLLAYRMSEAIDMYSGFYGCNASGITDAQRTAEILHACQAVAVRSCPEYEGESLNLLEKIIGKTVIPVGLLPPDSAKGINQITHDGSWSEIFQWLDEQKARSVVFVGFGSECKLTKDQVYEIAHGLELSELPFLWALRKPEWAKNNLDALPLGFEDRSRGKGVVCLGWVPQIEILSHSSIGGSLFHAGWGSVIETLQFGHCLIVLPFIIDQPLNARVLVEKGLAVEVERNEDGCFTKEDIAKALRLAMVSEKGENLRIRAREAGVIFRDNKLHEDYLAKFVGYLEVNVKEKASKFNHS